MDHAIFYSVLNQCIGALGLFTSLYLAGIYFSPEQRGFYFTFSSIVALQAVFEMGFGQCVIQFASHEFAFLSFDESGGIAGVETHRRRLIVLGRLALKWYGTVAVLLLVLLGFLGQLFFGSRSTATISWAGPWWMLCLVTALGIYIQPLWYMLEGCNQVAWINRARFWANISKAGVLCLSIFAGAGLYSGGLAVSAYIFVGTIMLFVKWGKFFSIFSETSSENTLSWKSEIWPFQWKIAVSWIGGYLAFNLFNPIIFHLQGPVVAGRFGMSWALVQGLSVFAMTWGSTKVPRYGMLISKNDYAGLNQLWFHALKRSLAFCLAGGIGIVAVLEILHAKGRFAGRFVTIPEMILLVLGTLVNQVIFSEAFYMRAHKKEPLLVLSCTVGVASVIAIAAGSKFMGNMGAVSGYLFVTIAAALWATYIFNRFRFNTYGIATANHRHPDL